MAPFDSDTVQALAPTGKLRASINLGNPILANRGPDGQVTGVSVDLASELGRWLGKEVELVVFDTASKSVEAVTSEQADFGFFAVDPARAGGIFFTAPYILIEGAYLVPQGSPLQRNEEVDQAAHRVVVGKGSAYDLYLSRELKQAQLVRAASSQAVVETFVQERADVAAGVRQQLEADMRHHSGLRLLPGRFMVIQQAMGLPRSRGEQAADALQRFIETMKSQGFVAQAMLRNGIQGASVAPAGERPRL
jgi:polar amino acid transport system substrate-binding protein